jgi:Fem-1 family protein b
LAFGECCGNELVVWSFKGRFVHYFDVLEISVTGMSPLIAAAERTRAEVVEYLVTRSEVSNLERIEALELLGASYANDKDNYCLESAYQYLHQTMEMR